MIEDLSKANVYHKLTKDDYCPNCKGILGPVMATGSDFKKCIRECAKCGHKHEVTIQLAPKKEPK